MFDVGVTEEAVVKTGLILDFMSVTGGALSELLVTGDPKMLLLLLSGLADIAEKMLEAFAIAEKVFGPNIGVDFGGSVFDDEELTADFLSRAVGATVFGGTFTID